MSIQSPISATPTGWKIPQKGPVSAIDEIIAETKAIPKQDYTEAHQKIQDKTEPQASENNASSETGASDQAASQSEEIPSSEADYEAQQSSSDKSRNRRTAEAFIGIGDMGIGFWGGHRSLEHDYLKFRAKPNDKAVLVEELTGYLNTFEKPIDLPPWLNLSIAATSIYGPTILRIEEVRKLNIQAMQKEAARKKENVFEDEIHSTKPSSATSSPVQKADQKVEVFDTEGNLVKEGYWEKKGKENPVSDQVNKERAADGGIKCVICEENYCKPGSEVCSQSCSAINTTKKKA